jgi:hypothetical protein
LDKDKNLAHQEEVLNNAGFDLSGQPGRFQDPTKKCGFDNYAAL